MYVLGKNKPDCDIYLVSAVFFYQTCDVCCHLYTFWMTGNTSGTMMEISSGLCGCLDIVLIYILLNIKYIVEYIYKNQTKN